MSSSRNPVLVALGLAVAWLFGTRAGLAQTRVVSPSVAITSTPQGVFVTDGARVLECDPRPGNTHGPTEPSCSPATRLER